MSILTKFDAINPQELAEFLVQRKRLLTADVRKYLSDNFNAKPGENSKDPANLELYQEVRDQLTAVKALRKHVISSAGEITGTVRDAKEAISSVTSLLTTLVRLEQEVMNMERVRSIEQATIEALKETDASVHQRFLQLLEEKLKS